MDNVSSPGRKGKMLTVAVLTILIAISFSAIASSDESDAEVIESGSCGENLQYTITQTDDKYALDISGWGSMGDEDGNDFETPADVPWNNYRSLINSVSLPNNITTIGNYAFMDFTNVAGQLHISNYVSKIGTYALANSKFSSIDVDSGNHDYKSDSNGYLYNYNMSKLIQVPAGKAENTFTLPSTVTTIGEYSFSGCTFRSVLITSYVETIEDNAFTSATLESMTFGLHFDVSVSTSWGLSFYQNDKTTPATVLKGLKFDLKSNKMIQTADSPETITITFDATCKNLDPIEEVKNMPVILPTAVEHATLELTFKGWLNTQGEPVDPVYDGSTDAEFRAKWVVTVTFDSNGGSSVDPIEGNRGEQITAPDAPTIDKLTFEKWIYEPQPGETRDVVWPVTLSENVTYTAVWKVQVTFDSQGGSDVNPIMIEPGTSLGDKYPQPTKTGYTFEGWYDAITGGELVEPDRILTESQTLYASWASIGQFNMIFYCIVDDVQIIIEEKQVAGGTAITAPSSKTFQTNGMTYYIEKWKYLDGEDWKYLEEGMIAEKDMNFKGEWVKAINITTTIEDKTYAFYAESDYVYILSNTYVKMAEKSKEDSEFTFTIIFNHGSITLDSTFMKAQKSKDMKVGIIKLSSGDIPQKVLEKAGADPRVYNVIYENESVLSSVVTVKLYYEVSEKQEKERLYVSGIYGDGSAVGALDGTPTNDGISFKTKNLVYFAVKYDSTSYLIKYMNEDKLFQYYLVEKGAEIPVPKENPTKEPTKTETYEFKEWTGYTEGMLAFTDWIFPASYTTEPRLYTIDFVAEIEGHKEIVESKLLAYGEKINAPTCKTVTIYDKSYEIVSWQGLSGQPTVTSDHTFYAELKEAGSNSWIYIVICIFVVFVIVEAMYMYNKKFRD